MSASSTARTSVVAGLENALKKIGYGLADVPFGTSDEEFEAANTAEIELLKAAIAARFEGKTITVLDAQLFGTHGRGETISDVVLHLKVEGEGRGYEAIQHPSISFRKKQRSGLFGLFGLFSRKANEKKGYKITTLTR